jgi:ABC-type nitrate/sulfonate/bicarbonate transport system substrate-binding protein/outer membrane protein OmpA-like peptidoglycan-associated protein
VAVFGVVAALIAFSVWRCEGKKSSGTEQNGKIDLKEIKSQAGGTGAGTASASTPEDPVNVDGLTTVKEYKFVSSERLPAVPSTSAYKPMQDRTVRFAINVWAGWAPIIYANEGFKAKKVWHDAKGNPFKVELVLLDNPVDMRNAFAAGEVHVGWATVDMLPLLIEGLRRDPRTMPRVFQQIDWSNGGDGIVVRDDIKSITDLRGKKVALAQNSPSHYFLLNALLNGGVQPNEVEMVFTPDAFQAARAYVANKDIAAAVSWSPDIYKISQKLKGSKLLVSTQTANKLIADVWFSRADFARDNPEIIEGVVRGILDADSALKDDAAKQQVAKWMADGYGMSPDDAGGMLGDAHWTNYAENKEFLLNQNNPTNFERTYNTAYLLYKAIGAVTDKTEFDQVMDFSVIQKLGKDDKYAKQTDEYQVNFTPTSAATIQQGESEILSKTVVISFFPNSFDLHKKIDKTDNGKTKEVLYDPNVDAVVEEIAKLAGQYGAARIVIEGHTDASMKGVVDDSLVKDLSQNRANAVKTELVNRFKLNPNQFSVVGYGWDKPADLNDPNNHAKNRRVEVKVYPAEAQ